MLTEKKNLQGTCINPHPIQCNHLEFRLFGYCHYFSSIWLHCGKNAASLGNGCTLCCIKLSKIKWKSKALHNCKSRCKNHHNCKHFHADAVQNCPNILHYYHNNRGLCGHGEVMSSLISLCLCYCVSDLLLPDTFILQCLKTISFK